MPDVLDPTTDAAVTAASDDFFKQAEAAFAAAAQEGQRQAVEAPAAAPPFKAAPATGAAAPAVAPAAGAPTATIPAFPAAARPAEAPAAAAAPAADDDPPREYRPGSVSKTHWEKLHSLKDTAVNRVGVVEKQLAAREAELAALKAAPVSSEAVAALRTERDKLLEELERVAVERSPRFEQQFKPRLEAALALAKQAVPPDRAAKVVELLQMPDSEWRSNALNEAAKDLSPMQLSRLTHALAQVDSISHERNTMAANSKQLAAQWRVEQEQQATASTLAREQQAVLLLQHEAAGFGDLLQGDSPEVQERLAIAKNVFMGKLSPPDLARAAVWVSVGHTLASQNRALLGEVETLKGELTKLRGVQSRPASDAGGNAASTAAAPTDENISYGDAIVRAAQQAGLRFG